VENTPNKQAFRVGGLTNYISKESPTRKVYDLKSEWKVGRQRNAQFAQFNEMLAVPSKYYSISRSFQAQKGFD